MFIHPTNRHKGPTYVPGSAGSWGYKREEYGYHSALQNLLRGRGGGEEAELI